jgi:hypothetical protein
LTDPVRALRYADERCPDGRHLPALIRCELIQDGVVLPYGRLLLPIGIQWIGGAPAIDLNRVETAFELDKTGQLLLAH